ncbi:hypothetical protein KJ059_09010 [Myxococcota bacterium]|nr:hypothetical protein [Myxococcota bacterium]MCZ7620790.1 hypothetical protein [Myxococcota bacterium]
MPGKGRHTIEISIASPPDRKDLVAEILVDREQLAEINREEPILRVEIYPKPSGGAWLLRFDELMGALEQARRRLEEIS